MYRLAPSSEAILNDYFEKYSPVVRHWATAFLNGETVKVEFKRCKPAFALTVKVDTGSGSFLERFLTDLRDDEDFLRKILIGDWDDIKDLISWVRNEGGDSCFKPLTKKSLGNRTKLTAESFYEVMKDIFVTKIFDGKEGKKNVFDKTGFISSMDLKVCPYCGAVSVIPTQKSGKANTKINPHIEHYLPKSAYPFLALNFHNLFPACPNCNRLENKGDISPYSEADDKCRIPYPYDFKAEDFTFDYSYNLQGENDPDNFNVEIDYRSNDHIKKGYTEVIAIESYYKNQTEEVRDLWNRLKTNSDSYRRQAGVQIKGSLPDPLTFRGFLGFADTEEESRREREFKFKKDIYLAMLRDIEEVED